jgi:hypothetical protein
MQSYLKQVPIGIDSFKEIIVKNGYYVDKTLLIRQIVENMSKVVLFTRPRRFGKTLNFNMLKCFLENPECRRYDNEDKDYDYLFKGLRILDDKEFADKHLGKYPVINLSFKKIKSTRFELAFEDFKKEISREYKRHRYVLESDILLDYERDKYMSIMSLKASQSDYTDAIHDLSEYLKKNLRQNIIVLIDEYDTPLHYAKLNGYYDDMLDVIRALMVDGMKDNENLEKALVTGIMKISQESIFSSFNNPKIAALTDGYCADMFGFTEDEVWEMLDYYGMKEYRKTIQEWYNGYIFGGDTVIYNPWSIISFIDSNEHKPKAYWVNTGDTAMIKRCMSLDQLKGKEYVERLYNGETIETEIEQNIVYEEVFNDVDKALSYLLHAGYLKAGIVEGKAETYKISIPNRELRQIYKSILKNWFTMDQKTGTLVTDIIKYLLDEDMLNFERHLASLLLTVSSYHDAAVGKENVYVKEVEEHKKYENFYHGLILGIMVNISDSYYVLSNREFGEERPDIVIMPKDKNKKAYILEFKNEYTTSERTAEEVAKEALKQIEENKYDIGVMHSGVKEVVRIGLGFKGKELKLAFGKQ